MLSVTFTPSDTVRFTTAKATTTITVNSAPPLTSPSLVVTKALTRSGGNVIAQLTITNTGGTAASNVTLTGVKIGADTTTPLPQNLGTIAAGASVQATVSVPDSVGTPGAANTMTITGAYNGGTFNSSARIALP